MRPLLPSLPLAFLPLILPVAAEEEPLAPGTPPSADACAQRADEAMGAAKRVDAALRELGADPAPATTSADTDMPAAPEGQSVAVSDGGLFFDAAHSQLVYLRNVRLSDARVKLRAANRLYLQLPTQGKEADTLHEGAQTAATAAVAGENVDAPTVETVPLPSVPLEITAYDAMVDSATNRIFFTSGPGVPELVLRQGENAVILTQGGDTPARALADESGNILLEAAHIHLAWQAEDGSRSEFRSTGGRVLFHAASHALVMEGPVEASYRDGESTISCSGPFCVTLKPAEGAPAPSKSGFMSQFTSMRFNGIAAASATGNVQLSTRTGGEGMVLSGDALYYNGLTGAVELPGTPCIISYGKDGCNTLQLEGSLSLEPNGDIHLRGKGNIEGSYERPAREEGAVPLRGTLSATAPLSFHADSGTVTTRALTMRDAEASLSCTGDILLTLAPRTEEELEQAKLPEREKAGMVNMALANYSGIAGIKASGQVRGQLLNPAAPTTPEATLAASQLNANLNTGEFLLTGVGEDSIIAFQGYSLSGTADTLTHSSVHLKPNGDIEARGAQVTCTVPGNKGLTTITSTDRILLAREPRSLSLGPGTRLQSPDGIVTTNGSMQAVLAPSTKPTKPLSPRFPHLTYDFSGLDSAETFEGGTIRTAQGSLQCTQHLSILMMPQGDTNASTLGGIRSAIASGRVLIAAKDASGRVMRATGDRLEIDGISGEKKLTGSRVVLEDARNRHEASGEGAAVRIDARNNARITGARHTTSATDIRGQVEDNKAQQPSQKPN